MVKKNREIEQLYFSITTLQLFLKKTNKNLLSNSLKTAYTIDFRRCLVSAIYLLQDDFCFLINQTFSFIAIIISHPSPPRKTFLF